MKCVVALGMAGLVALGGGTAARAGGTWYVPMEELAPGGFDHIQILMEYPYRFDAEAMSAFGGPTPVGDQWALTFVNEKQTFATADGPNTGNLALHFAVWIDGDRTVDRPAFHLQAYSGSRRVDNADVVCFGPGELDWLVAPGTWTIDRPIPPWLRGDFDFDTDVDADDIDLLYLAINTADPDPIYDLIPGGVLDRADMDEMIHIILETEYGDLTLDQHIDAADLSILAANWMSTGLGWAAGDVTGDGRADAADLSLMAANWMYGAPVGAMPPDATIPEPMTAALLGLGMLAVSRMGRCRRASQSADADRSRPPLLPQQVPPTEGSHHAP